MSEYTIQIPNDPDVLKFDSKFECGNLRKAVKVEKDFYVLLLEPDTGNRNLTQ